MNEIENIEVKINKLSPAYIGELNTFIDFLISKQKTKDSKPRKLKQDWAGGLKQEKYTSMELQKKALDWR